MKLSGNLASDSKAIKEILTSQDIEFLDVIAGEKKGLLIFARDLVDKEAIGELILKPLSHLQKDFLPNEFGDLFLSPEKKQIYSIGELTHEVVLGNAVVICDGIDFAISFGLVKYEKRAITEPPTSAVVKGPREGFVESLPVNVSLMRRRIKSEKLQFEYLNVGEYSKSPVAICYVQGIAKPELVEKLKEKLKKIKIDAVLDSSYIAKFLGQHKTSIFKQAGNTEKPDILAAKILEGRVAIFVDGSPIALTLPYLLVEDFQSPSDYYGSSYNATLSRVVRLISVMISILLPAFFVSSQLFHLQLIPLSFLLTIVNSIKGIPLSPSYEMFFTLLIFEVLNEASVRMPRSVGMVVSIVGALVLGETAVKAGIISAPTLIIIALSGICLFTVPELEKSFSLIRLLILVVAGSFGGYGILLSLALLLIYLVSFENYGTPLLAPFSPLVKKDLKDGVYKGFLNNNSTRPFSITRSKIKRTRDGERKT